MPDKPRRRRLFAWVFSGLLVLAAVVLAYAYAEARRDPVVRRANLALHDWPFGGRPITVALLSDIHLGNAAMDGARLARIADQVTALRPDVVLIAGDVVDGRGGEGGEQFAGGLAAPLSRLRAPLGVVAVLGNHDHWASTNVIARSFARAGITLLANQAVRRGPLAIAGVDDEYTHHDQANGTLASARRLGGATVVLSHAPDLARRLPTGVLLLAGHTHCGQVVLPAWGPATTHSWVTGEPLFDPRYRCGLIHDSGRTLVVTAGLGTSDVPLRLGAPPDIWLVRLGPPTPSP